MADNFEQLVQKAHERELGHALSAALAAAQAAELTDLVTWVRLELLGYFSPVMTAEMDVPDYRTVGGHWVNEYRQQLAIADPRLSFMNEIRLREGVLELESFVGAPGTISLRLPDLSATIKEHFDVEVTVFQFSPQSVTQVLANIRAQLLDRLVANRQQLAQSVLPVVADRGADIIALRPGLYGISVDLRALWRRLQSKR